MILFPAGLCEGLPNPDNGIVMVTGLTEGSNAIYTCDRRYQLIAWRTDQDLFEHWNVEWTGTYLLTYEDYMCIHIYTSKTKDTYSCMHIIQGVALVIDNNNSMHNNCMQQS